MLLNELFSLAEVNVGYNSHMQTQTLKQDLQVRKDLIAEFARLNVSNPADAKNLLELVDEAIDLAYKLGQEAAVEQR